MGPLSGVFNGMLVRKPNPARPGTVQRHLPRRLGLRAQGKWDKAGRSCGFDQTERRRRGGDFYFRFYIGLGRGEGWSLFQVSNLPLLLAMKFGGASWMGDVQRPSYKTRLLKKKKKKRIARCAPLVQKLTN